MSKHIGKGLRAVAILILLQGIFSSNKAVAKDMQQEEEKFGAIEDYSSADILLPTSLGILNLVQVPFIASRWWCDFKGIRKNRHPLAWLGFSFKTLGTDCSFIRGIFEIFIPLFAK